nr:MAG TPA: hypothetical protein [Caudoviricetes sp.]
MENYDLRHDLSAESNFGFMNTGLAKDTRK